MILNWIYSSLTPEIMGQIIGYQTSHEAWFALEKIFSASSKARVMQLRLEFQTMKKRSLSMMDYILKLKNLVDNLAAIGEPVHNRDHILQLLGGLGVEYGAQYSNSTEDNVISTNLTTTSSYHHKNRRNSNRNFSGNNSRIFNPGRNSHANRNSASQNRPQCQLCGKFGHVVARCYHRFDINFQGSPSKVFQLKRVLHAPHLATNLVSVSQFYADNNTFVEFHHQFFLVKEQVTKKVLLKGHLERGLYKFSTSFSSSTDCLFSSFNNSSSSNSTTELWHSRLGHPAEDILKHAFNNFFPTLSPSTSSNPSFSVSTPVFLPIHMSPSPTLHSLDAQQHNSTPLSSPLHLSSNYILLYATIHPMITRAKDGIVKKKAFLSHMPTELATFAQASKSIYWTKAMQQEAVFMSQPPGFINTRFPTHVCKLNKAIYGLKQAPRAWYTKLSHALLGWGFQVSRADNSMFFLHTTKDVLILLIYVDDILVTSSDPHRVSSFASRLNVIFLFEILVVFTIFLVWRLCKQKTQSI
ncbi:hypothetical protein AAG906_011972 [Vitis piasezkii]